MADTPQTLSLITLGQAVEPRIIRTINRRATALSLLPVETGEGKNLYWAIEGSGAVAENYSEGATASNFGSDSQNAALLSWGMYRANFKVTGLAAAAAKTSATPDGNRRLWMRNIQNAIGAWASMVNAALFSGAGTGTTICGLDEAIGSASNTYAGIDRSSSTYAHFRPTVIDPGSSTVVRLANLRDDLRRIFDASGETPDLALCPTAVHDALASLFDPQVRREMGSPAAMVVNTAAGPVTMHGSNGKIEFEGCQFVRDKDATASRIYYITTDAVRVRVLPSDEELEAIANARAAQVEIPETKGPGGGLLPYRLVVVPLAKVGDAQAAMAKAYLQLEVTRPNACGVRKNVATPAAA